MLSICNTSYVLLFSCISVSYTHLDVYKRQEYKYVVPKGFVRFLGKLAELSDNGVEIHIFIGNHDIWMFDYLPKEIGAIIHRDVLTVDPVSYTHLKITSALRLFVHTQKPHIYFFP